MSQPTIQEQRTYYHKRILSNINTIEDLTRSMFHMAYPTLSEEIDGILYGKTTFARLLFGVHKLETLIDKLRSEEL